MHLSAIYYNVECMLATTVRVNDSNWEKYQHATSSSVASGHFQCPSIVKTNKVEREIIRNCSLYTLNKNENKIWSFFFFRCCLLSQTSNLPTFPHHLTFQHHLTNFFIANVFVRNGRYVLKPRNLAWSN
jgi:hypothetical protein